MPSHLFSRLFQAGAIHSVRSEVPIDQLRFALAIADLFARPDRPLGFLHSRDWQPAYPASPHLPVMAVGETGAAKPQPRDPASPHGEAGRARLAAHLRGKFAAISDLEIYRVGLAPTSPRAPRASVDLS